MNIKDIEKHNYVGRECRCISFDIANHRFMCIKQNERTWLLRSYEEIHIPPIAIEMNTDKASLSQIADTAMLSLFDYLDDRQGLIQEFMLSIRDNIQGGVDIGK